MARHDELMRIYRASQTPQASASTTSAVASHDMAVLQRHFQFIRDDAADLERGASDWQVRMSVRYYRKLFREYALADLSRYKEGKVGLRWRTEMEVVAGKGQFVCGNKACDCREELHSYELLFAYVEHGEKKRCLVKVRACEACARKLFYRKLKEVEKKQKKKEKRQTRETEEEEEARGKKRKRGEVKEEEGDGGKRRGMSVHALCAEINAEDTRDWRGERSADTKAKTSDETGADDEEAKQLRALLV